MKLKKVFIAITLFLILLPPSLAIFDRKLYSSNILIQNYNDTANRTYVDMNFVPYNGAVTDVDLGVYDLDVTDVNADGGITSLGNITSENVCNATNCYSVADFLVNTWNNSFNQSHADNLYAKYNFGSNNFNGSGDLTTVGDVTSGNVNILPDGKIIINASVVNSDMLVFENADTGDDWTIGLRTTGPGSLTFMTGATTLMYMSLYGVYYTAWNYQGGFSAHMFQGTTSATDDTGMIKIVNEAQDYMIIGVGQGDHGESPSSLVIGRTGHYNRDYAPVNRQPNPNLLIYSGSHPETYPNEYIELYHNSTNPIITSGKGNIIIENRTQFQKNMTLVSPDGTNWNCGVSNAGAFSCS